MTLSWNTRRSIVAFCALTLSGPVLAFAQDAADTTDELKTTPTAVRLTYESFTLPGNESMGMVATNLLFDMNDQLRLGVGSYGSVDGQRGGFITLGVAGELQQRLAPSWMSHAGLYVGAGGGRGGYTLSGGGLMLRGDAGLTYETAGYGNFGVGVSYVKFPSGVITSTQPYVSYELPFDTVLSPGWKAASSGDSSSGMIDVRRGANAFGVVARSYQFGSSIVRDNGQPQGSMQLLGVEWTSYMDDRLFLKVETEGAMGGENNGYMQILLGGGYRLPLWNSSALKLHVAAGPAGGGTANTGGGLLLDGGIGFEQNLTDRTALEISLGGVTTPTRKFEAVSLGLKLNYQFGLPNASAEPASWNNLLSAYNTADLRVRLTNQTYFKGDPQWRNQFIDQPVSNLGVQLDYFVTPNWFLTGQALAAYEGKAGAYMVGEVGTGLQWPVTKRLFVEGEVLVGAAGGGGLAVSGGLVGQANASVGYHLTDTLSLLATLGRIEALSGNFKANVAGASLTYQFTGFTRK